MIHSMTAFARQTFDGVHGIYTWEIRSVNHRYCEIFVRLPEELRGLEAALREQISKSAKRGKIDCNLRFEAKTSAEGELSINDSAVAQLKTAHEHLNEIAGPLAPLRTPEILNWPGVLANAKVAVEEIESEALTGFAQALKQLRETRQREGEKLAEVVKAKCEEIKRLVDTMRTRVPEIITAVKTRHQQRIEDIIESVDASRVEQEIALLMQKLDVVEELDRLDAHLSEVTRVLSANAPAGRRLDFLMQELNREANTLGSKSAHVDSSNASIDLKVAIEQIREQIQNIE